MLFTAFLDEYYSPIQKEKIISILNETGIFRKLDKFVSSYYRFMIRSPEDKRLLRFRKFVVGYLLISEEGISNARSAGLKESATEAIIDSGKNFILYSCRFPAIINGKYNAEMGAEIKDFSLAELIDFTLRKGLNAIAGSKSNPAVATPDNAKACRNYLHWNVFGFDEKEKIGKNSFARELADVLKAKSIAAILLMFGKPKDDYHVIIHPDNLFALLLLFSILEQCGRITVDNKPGLYAFLQYRLRAPAGLRLPVKAFRKIKNEGMKSKNKHDEANKLISGLIAKYGSNG